MWFSRSIFSIPQLILLATLFAIQGSACTRSIQSNPIHAENVPIKNNSTGEIGQNQVSISQEQQADFKIGNVVESGYLDDQRFLVIQIPESMDGDYFGKVGEAMIHCARQKQMPQRLYCFGKIPARETSQILLLISPNDGTIEMQVEIPENDEY